MITTRPRQQAFEYCLTRWCDEVVSEFDFYSDDPSLNLAEVYSFYSLKLFEKNERGRLWTI